ncbi:hypothetical protein, partial [Zooshikella harenae]
MSKLALNIAIGAFLDKSLGKSIKKSQSSAARLGRAYRETNKQLAAIREVNRYQNRLRELRQQQTLLGYSSSSLASEIASVESQFATAQQAAAQLGVEVGNLAAEQQQLEATSHWQGFAIGLNEHWSEFAETVSTVVQSLTVMSGAISGVMTATNALTAEQLGLAQSYGMTIEQFQAWGGLAAQAGLNAENTGDLVEELTNKVGEFKALGEQSALSEVFDSLGMDQFFLEGMSSVEQFEFIMQRLMSLKDDQAAASLADMLMGGEGNKIITYLRNSGQSLDQVLATQNRFNQLSTKGAQGATAYHRSITQLFNTFKSAWAEISGVVGGELAPSISSWSESAANFARQNKTQLIKGLKLTISVIKGFGSAIWTAIKGVKLIVNQVAEWAGGFENLARIGGVVLGTLLGVKLLTGVVAVYGGISALITAAGGLSAVLPAVAVGIKAIGTAIMANPIGLAIKAIALGASILIMYWEPISSFFLELWASVKQPFVQFWDWAKNVFFSYSPIGILIKKWEPISGFFSETWDNIKGKFLGAWDLIKGIFNKSPIGMLLKHWKPGFEWLASKFSWIKDVISRVFNWFGDDEDEDDNDKKKAKPQRKPS